MFLNEKQISFFSKVNFFLWTTSQKESCFRMKHYSASKVHGTQRDSDYILAKHLVHWEKWQDHVSAFPVLKD